MFAATHTTPKFDLSGLKAAAAQTPDDRQVEQAFAEQVYQMVANKAGPLMEGPYRIGFEVVSKNDENTKMMGIWAFRLAPDDRDNLVYVPCFFHNGRISVDSLYQVRKKRFRAFTPEWCQQLIDTSALANGQPIPKSQTSKFRPQVHLERVLNSTHKMAGQTDESIAFFKSRDLKTDLADMCEQLEFSQRPLRALAQQIGGKKVAAILLSAAEASEKFACAMAEHLNELEPLFSLDPPFAAAKQASQTDRVLCSFTAGSEAIKFAKSVQDPEQRAKVAAKVQQSRSWFEGLLGAEDSPDYTSIYQGGEKTYEVTADPGQITILTRDGDTEEVVFGREVDIWNLANPRHSPSEVREIMDGSGPCGTTAGLSPARAQNFRVAGLQTRSVTNHTGPLVLAGAAGVDEKARAEEVAKNLEDLDAMAVGKTYILWHPQQKLLAGPFTVDTRRKTDDGVSYTLPGGDVILYRKEADEPFGFGVLNGSWKALRLDVVMPENRSDKDCYPVSTTRDYKKPLWPASKDSLRNMLNRQVEKLEGEIVKRASIKYDQNLFELRFGDREALPCDHTNAMIKLAGTLAIHPVRAQELLDQATQDGEVEFHAWLPSKYASQMLRIVDSPEFTWTTDPILQVRTEEPQLRVLRTERSPVYTPAMRIGDHYRMPNNGVNPEDSEDLSLERTKQIPDDVLLRGDPNTIAQYAGTKGIVSVLDHGVLASMAKVYDVSTYLDEYLNMLEEGLDGLGRVLFMFRWKPEDFRKLYGTDDIKELEDKLLSSFKSLGDVLLDLMRQSKHQENSQRTA